MSSGGGTSRAEGHQKEESGDAIMEESEPVPSSLAHIVGPILRAADEIEKANPRVAYLCRFTASKKAHTMDASASEDLVRRFKTQLTHRLEKEERETQRRLASDDAKEVYLFYDHYCRKNLHAGLQMRKPDGDEMAKYYQIAAVLIDVIKIMSPADFHPESDKYIIAVEKEKPFLTRYNILPLNISGPKQPIMEIPEIKAAVGLLRMITNLPDPNRDPTSILPIVRDLLDWLGLAFGFQKGNVENQKEHLILLLGNIQMREGRNAHRGERYNQVIQSTTVIYLMKKIFQNYISWCRHLDLESNIKIPKGASTQQPELLYVGLYLLIWGEASNVRFMPECLCYIFHHMASGLYRIIREGVSFDPPFPQDGQDDAFLQQVIQPIYNVIQEEAVTSKHGTVNHAEWRNYDDLNEYFWLKKCFKQLSWPLNLKSDFFATAKKIKNETEQGDHVVSRHDNVVRRQGGSKTNFVEVRTFLHLFRSFDRLWAFFILALQAMVIIAWNPSGSRFAIFEPAVFRSILTVFITAAFLNFVQATLELFLNWKAWRSFLCSQMIRYILKFVVATAWLIILPTTYSSSVEIPTGLVKFFNNWIGNSQSESIYSFTVFMYLLPNILSVMFFIFLPIRRAFERSNSRIVRFLLWWSQPKLYVARGMYEDMCSILKYTLFWVLLLICKLAFSYYVEIAPLVRLTRTIIFLGPGDNVSRKFFPYSYHTLGVVFTLWAPIVMVYFMDTQIWYSIFSIICVGVNGTLSRLGEIQTLGNLKFRFETITQAFDKNLLPRHGSQSKRHELEEDNFLHVDKFCDVWNAFIDSLRYEDLISNRERYLLLVSSSIGDTTTFQWPLFLLANKVSIVLNMARGATKPDEELKQELNQDPYAYYAVKECYDTVSNILYNLVEGPDKEVIDRIRESIDDSIRDQSLSKEFRLDELRFLTWKLEKLTLLLEMVRREDVTIRIRIVNLLQDIMETITQDIMKNGHDILKDQNREGQFFANLNLEFVYHEAWKEKCVRLQLLLTTGQTATNVPNNLEARRRITFFANSLFMKMPRAPQVRSMMSFSVLTPYVKEDVLFSVEDLHKKNDNGISLLFYLRKIYPDEWKNFLQRINFRPMDEDSLKYKMEEICLWASYKGHTLGRTVRGMMYYRRALEIQCIQDGTDLATLDGHGTRTSYQEGSAIVDMAVAISDIKFTYVVSCQAFGMQKISKCTHEKARYLSILNLMKTYPSLRVAYIDKVDLPGMGTTDKTYYSVLVKGVGDKYDEEIYRIKLPGKPYIGEERSENKNNAITFTRGEALQTIDTDQDHYLEEAFKLRNVLEEFASETHGKSKPTILGIHKHIFTRSVASLAWFMCNQESTFVTIGQQVLANPLKVRFHYGHSDIFDRLFHITRGGVSKASMTVNLSQDIFSGFNSIMREGNVTHHEYIQVGKGYDGGLDQISSFEAEVANGNAEQTLSRDIYRLGRRFDFYRMMSLYFTTVGFYFSSMVTVLTVYVFLYGRLYLVMSGVEKSILLDPRIHGNIKPLDRALASQAIFELGLMLVLPMFMEVVLEKGLCIALGEFFILQLQLASVFFTFQLGTRTHYYGRTILHGAAKYRPAGCPSVVHRTKFAEIYRMYSRSHFVKGLELLILLVVSLAYGSSYHRSNLHLFVTFSIWFLVASWLFAPFCFNPSCFKSQKMNGDWIDWRRWMGNRRVIGMREEDSWEVWWIGQQEHLRKASICALLLEIILSLRFLMYQYVIVYHLNITRRSRSILVYAFSWLVMFMVVVILKIVSIGGQKFEDLLFLGSVPVMVVLFVVCKLTISDVFASILGFIPTGWCILLIGQACSPLLKETMLWSSVMELGRAYDYMMGLIIFLPINLLSKFSFVSVIQTRLLFDQAMRRGLQIPRLLAGQNNTQELD